MRIAKPVHRNFNAVKQKPAKQHSEKKERKERDSAQQSSGHSSTDSTGIESDLDNAARDAESFGQQGHAASSDLQGGQAQNDTAARQAVDETKVSQNRSAGAVPVTAAKSGSPVDSGSRSNTESAVPREDTQRLSSWVRIPFPLAPWIPTVSTAPPPQVPDSSGEVSDKTPATSGISDPSEDAPTTLPQPALVHGVNGWFSLNASQLREQTVDSLHEAHDASWKKARLTRPEFPIDTEVDE